jgi:hypothetical protein
LLTVCVAFGLVPRSSASSLVAPSVSELSSPVVVAARESAALQSKPTPKQAIHDGLVWLARHQNPDGSWSPKSLKERCPPGKTCGVEYPKTPFTPHYDEGVTGLAVLAFVRGGYGADAKQELVDPTSQHRYKPDEVVRRALEWLKKTQNNEGSFQKDRTFMYNQDVATLAMIEAAAATKSDAWKESAERGVEMIEKAQRPNPKGDGLWGWRYGSRTEVEAGVGKTPKSEKAKAELCDSDTSVTAWSIAALATARDLLGVQISKDSFAGAIDFLDYVSLTDGRVAYQNPDQAGATVTGPNDQFTYHPAAMSALGMVVRLNAHHDRKHPFFELAAQRILQDLPTLSADNLSTDYYYWYEASIALNRFDGEGSGAKAKKKYSGPWNKAATQALLALQDHAKGACTNGGWVTPDRWSYTGGAVYCTAMGVLALEACNPK